MNQGERGDWAEQARGRRDRRRPASRSTTSTSTGSAAPARFDDRNKKITQAMAKLLQRAGIDFAILGPSEICTGDPARRSGNEYIFQMLAMQNIETLNGMGVKKIITQCPHCFNTLKNEYPQLGGNYEVVHHCQLLERARRRRAARPRRRLARGAGRLPRLLLPRPPQRRVPRAPQRHRLARRHRHRRDAAQRHQGHVLRRRRRAHVDGGDASARRSTPSAAEELIATGASRDRHRLPVLLRDDRRRREGCRQGATRSRSPTSP